MTMKKSSKARTRMSGVGVIAAALLAVNGGAAWANGGDTTIVHACVNKVTHIARIVGANDRCNRSEHTVHWSITGPAGPQGPQGIQGIQGPAGPAGAAVTATDPVIVSLESSVEWDIAAAASTATAAGYCLANHSWTNGTPEFVTPEHPGGFTPSGYELPTLPIVGAVRRNFTRDRVPGAGEVNGINQTCSQACSTFMSGYGPAYRGAALQRRYSSGAMQADGLNDLGGYVAGTTLDTDFYKANSSKPVIAGIHARVDGYLEADVAQADICCCGLVAP